MDMRSWVLVGVALASPAPLFSQHTRPTGAPRVAGIAPPPAPVVVAPSVVPGPVFYGNVPVLVLGDGRVFADFGRGYEQVVRTCGLPVAYGGVLTTTTGPVQPVVTQPTVAQPTVGGVAQVPYTPPVPAQQTASQQLAAAGQPAQVVQQNSQMTVGQPCWGVRSDGYIIARP